MKPAHEILCQEPRGVLSLTGGGGKTSLMFHLAGELARSGRRVLTTTTTKILLPTLEQSRVLLTDPDPEAILRQASSRRDRDNHVTAAAASLPGSGKLQGFSPEAIRIFRESALFDWILVEADGAGRRPLKAPAGHEPVIPPDTTVLVAVAGLEVIGAPLSEELVFRSSLAAPLMELSPGAAITPAAVARLLAHPLGGFKNAPPKARRLIFLNKGDTPERISAGAAIACALRGEAEPVAEAVLVGQALGAIRIHAKHRLLQ